MQEVGGSIPPGSTTRLPFQGWGNMPGVHSFRARGPQIVFLF